MLSNYTYSKYAINKGYNDDVKLFSPYYFELISNPRELETGYWEFEHCKVKLNSSYFNFSGGSIPPQPINYWNNVDANEKPFKQLDNKYYFVIWRGDENFDWRIIKFKNDTDVGSSQKTIDNLKDQYYLILGSYFGVRAVNLYIHQPGFTGFTHLWVKNDNYFKFVYCWNDDKEPNTPFISPKTGQIIDWNLK
ncbi:hypothetical protein [Spiroplasma endosymbiont of Seladonia tumulorum]|uniref:hypothetical protein n=1 Tax=Spiroplasma endosymbiont of Seladonia tumulorum TaxID=3066321 RepID=UPI0030CC80CF